MTTPSTSAQWKLVPVEPTPEMIEAGEIGFNRYGGFPGAYRSMLASAPAPASGRVDAVPAEDSLVLVRRDMIASACAAIRLKKDAPKTVEYLRAASFAPASGSADDPPEGNWFNHRSALSPAATPVSEAGGEGLGPISRAMREKAEWHASIGRRRDNVFSSAEVLDLIAVLAKPVSEAEQVALTGDTKEVVDRLRAVTGSTRRLCLDAAMLVEHLAKPASSPAGVREAAELLSHLKLYVLEKLDADDADALRDRMHDLTAALSQPTSGGRVGE